jgi:hypothetical protein
MEHSYKDLYLSLFRGMDRAVAALDRGDAFAARRILIAAMEAAEAAHLEQDILPEQ